MDAICNELKHYDMDHRIMAAEDLRNRLSRRDLSINTNIDFAQVIQALTRAITQDHSSEVRRAAGQAMSEVIIDCAHNRSKERLLECIKLVDAWLWDDQEESGYNPKTKKSELNDCAAYVMSCVLLQLESEKERKIPQDMLGPVIIEVFLETHETMQEKGRQLTEGALNVLTEVARRATPSKRSLAATTNTLFSTIMEACSGEEGVENSNWHLLKKQVRLLVELGRWVSWTTIGLWVQSLSKAWSDARERKAEDDSSSVKLMIEALALLTAKYHRNLLDASNADAFEILKGTVVDLARTTVEKLDDMDIDLFETVMASLATTLPGCLGIDFSCNSAAALVEAMTTALDKAATEAALAVETTNSEMYIEPEDDEWDIELADEDGGLEANDEGGSDWRRTVAMTSALHGILTPTILYDDRGDTLMTKGLSAMIKLGVVSHERIIASSVAKAVVDILGTYLNTRDRVSKSLLQNPSLIGSACDLMISTSDEAVLGILIRLLGALSEFYASEDCHEKKETEAACGKLEMSLISMFNQTSSASSRLRILDALCNVPTPSADIQKLTFDLFSTPSVVDVQASRDIWSRIASTYVSRTAPQCTLKLPETSTPSLQELEFRSAIAEHGGQWTLEASAPTSRWLEAVDNRRGLIDAILSGLMVLGFLTFIQSEQTVPREKLAGRVPSKCVVYPLTLETVCPEKCQLLQEALRNGRKSSLRWESGYIFGLCLTLECDSNMLFEATTIVTNAQAGTFDAFENALRVLKGSNDETTLRGLALASETRKQLSVGSIGALIAWKGCDLGYLSGRLCEAHDAVAATLYAVMWAAKFYVAESPGSTPTAAQKETCTTPPPGKGGSFNEFVFTLMGPLSMDYDRVLRSGQYNSVLIDLFSIPVLQDLFTNHHDPRALALVPTGLPSSILEEWRSRCPNPPIWDYRAFELPMRTRLLAVMKRIWLDNVRDLVLTKHEQVLCELVEMEWKISTESLRAFDERWPLNLTCQDDIPCIAAVSGFYLRLLQSGSPLFVEAMKEKPEIVSQMLRLVESDEAYVMKVDFGGGRSRSSDAAIELRRFGIQLLSATLTLASPSGIRELLRSGDTSSATFLLSQYHMIAEANLSGVLTGLAEEDDTLATLATNTLTQIVMNHPDLGDMVKCNAEKLRQTLTVCHRYFTALLSKTQMKEATNERLKSIEGLTNLIDRVSLEADKWVPWPLSVKED